MRIAAATKRKRIAAGVIALVMAAAVLFAAFFIAVEADHDCVGEGCAVCACIQACVQSFRQFGAGRASSAAAAVCFWLLVLSAFFFLPTFLPQTPVAKKVRLNN
ncbi:MAG: hypothetical protein IJU96_00405 [Clostridia bacterium]|nr:hypothetical protein [Clostridia bacterium]